VKICVICLNQDLQDLQDLMKYFVCIYPVHPLIGGYPDMACTTLRYQTFFFKVSEISGIFGQLSVDIDLAFLTVREQ
jgi:hypothetical protein